MTCNCCNNSGAIPVASTECTCGCSSSQSSATVVQSTGCDCSAPCTSPCPEDHSTCITTKVYTTTIRITHAWNMPAVGFEANVHLDSVENILPGAIVWNPSIGYLTVKSYDPATGYVLLTNTGETGNLPEGGSIPSCTEFHVCAPDKPSTGSGTGTTAPFLAADFVAPGNGNCANMKVTTVTGINVNDIISVAGYQYRVNQIIDIETIEVCDEGLGAPIGTVIEEDANCDGVLDVPILVVSSDDPCTEDPVNSGVIIVCDEGIRKPYEGTEDGQITKWDEALQRWVLINANILEECTILTICLTIDVGNIGPYLITVSNSAIFNVGTKIVIGSRVFTVTQIVSPTQIRATADVVPVAIEEYAVGTQVCIQDCCAYLPQEVDDLEVRVAQNESDIADIVAEFADLSLVASVGSSTSSLADIDGSPGNDYRELTDVLNVANPSTIREMNVMIQIEAEVEGLLDDGNWATLRPGSDIVPVGAVLGGSSNGYRKTLNANIGGAYDLRADFPVHLMHVNAIAASSAATFTGRVSISHLAGTGTYTFGDLTSDDMNITMNVLGVLT